VYVGRRGVEVIDVGRGSIWVDLGRSRGVRGWWGEYNARCCGFF
jgi:hypothetical protein